MKAVAISFIVLLCAASALAHEQRMLEVPCVLIPDTTAPLPRAVVRVIMNSKEGAFARKFYRDRGEDPYKSAPLQGVQVHLSDAGGRTYLIGGADTPMTGADNRWYWLVRKSGSHARILLYVGTGCIRIGSKMSHGYRNIETEWQVPGRRVVREYWFDGQTYKLFREESGRKSPSIE